MSSPWAFAGGAQRLTKEANDDKPIAYISKSTYCDCQRIQKEMPICWHRATNTMVFMACRISEACDNSTNGKNMSIQKINSTILAFAAVGHFMQFCTLALATKYGDIIT